MGAILHTEGTTTVTGGLTIGGTVLWENTGSLTQSGGAVTVGDASGNKAELYNAPTGTYDIADDSGIGIVSLRLRPPCREGGDRDAAQLDRPYERG